MNLEKMKEDWIREEKRVFLGWDFTSLEGRMIEASLPWSYKDVVLKYLKNDRTLLDMGTGGGEFLRTLNHPYGLTSVTEGFVPNYDLCVERLEPLGVCVKFVGEDGILPFGEGVFDVVINRHEHFVESEVMRVLKPGGVFVTQQVGCLNNLDFSRWFLQLPEWSHSCDNVYEEVLERFETKGCDVLLSDTCRTPLKFLDVGALVYFMKIIEWEFPNFSVDNHFDRLLEVERVIRKKGYIESTEHRYIIVCRKNET